MKIQIIVEPSYTIDMADPTGRKSTETTKEIIDDIASMVEELSKRHPKTIYPHLVEVTITEKR